VSPGSEPERDDSGLPPVDIEIPDDARELDRDVLAYRREIRALRRQDRQRARWRRWLGKDGIVLPLLACCLVLALITGTLLTVFTATSEQGPTAPPGGASSALASPHIVRSGLLPRTAIYVDGRSRLPLDTLKRTMLVLVPPGCSCRNTLQWLADVALTAHVPAYLVYNKRTSAEVEGLYAQLDTDGQTALLLAEDRNHVLTTQGSFPPGVPASKLTAILVGPDRTVRYATGLSPIDGQAALISAING
jgi:hypothetical protein